MQARCLDLLVVVTTLAAFGSCHHATEIDPSPTVPLHSRWNGTIESPQTLAGAIQIHGSAWIGPISATDSSRTTANISIANAAANGIHPWAVRQGQCAVRRRHGDQGDVAHGRVVPQGNGQAEPVHRGHHQIHQDRFRPLQLHHVQGRFGVMGHDGWMSVIFQDVDQQLCDAGLVIDYENQWGSFRNSVGRNGARLIESPLA